MEDPTSHKLRLRLLYLLDVCIQSSCFISLVMRPKEDFLITVIEISILNVNSGLNIHYSKR